MSIFAADAGIEFDWEAEMADRNTKEIYVLHRDEFFSDEMGWDSQSTLTWYEGDQILADDRDCVIYNWDAMVGELKFGHGSGDPNVFYVRNERLQAEYEVLRDEGSYEIEVLGQQANQELTDEELRHSRDPGKFRWD